jgi:hypothetical protein
MVGPTVLTQPTTCRELRLKLSVYQHTKTLEGTRLKRLSRFFWITQNDHLNQMDYKYEPRNLRGVDTHQETLKVCTEMVTNLQPCRRSDNNQLLELLVGHKQPLYFSPLKRRMGWCHPPPTHRNQRCVGAHDYYNQHSYPLMATRACVVRGAFTLRCSGGIESKWPKWRGPKRYVSQSSIVPPLPDYQ